MARTKANRFAVGDTVKVLSIPDWLIADLPKAEQEGILACVGREMQVSQIDKNGGVWVGFGKTVERGKGAIYSGQTFVIEPERIQLVRSVTRQK